MKSGTILSAALLLTSGAVSADDILWAATISPDGRTTVDIVDATEAGCNAQIAQSRDAVVVQPCQPADASRASGVGIGSDTSLSPIQDDGTGGRGSSRTLKPRPKP